MAGPSKINETINIPRGLPNLGRLFFHANAATGIAEAATIGELAALFAGSVPVKSYPDEFSMLSGSVAVGYITYVEDTKGFYLYAGPDSTLLTSYVLISRILDEDDFASDSDVAVPTQQSVKAYVDNATLGVVNTWKPPVKVATTVAGTLGTSFEPGQTIDGVALVAGDRILIKNQGLAVQNGIYNVQPSGAPLRAPDSDTGSELEGAAVLVSQGTSNENTTWLQTSDDIILGTTAILWMQLGTSVPDASETVKGISEEATQAQTDAGTAVGETGARLFVNPEKLAAYLGVNASQFLTENFTGNGSTTVFTIPEAAAIKIVAVFVGGQRLRDGTHYTKDETAKTVTISPAVITGVGIEVEYVKGLGVISSLPHWDESTWGLARIATFAEVMAGADDTKGVTPLKMKMLGDYTETPVLPAGGVIALDCNNQQQIRFLSSTVVTANHSITKSNTTNIQNISLVIPITGASISLTFPSDTRMARYNESGTVWNQSTKVLIVSSIGTADLHEFNLIKTGSVFILRYDGPVRA